jgi:hypothetical protein
MRTATFIAFAALGFLSLAVPLAHADPMKCSGEEATCISNCKKAARGPVSACLTACGARVSYCMKTGCWDNGAQRYCGLAKQ